MECLISMSEETSMPYIGTLTAHQKPVAGVRDTLRNPFANSL
jgi:hypothetical protein